MIETPITEAPWQVPGSLGDWFERVVVISLERRSERLAEFLARLPPDWPFRWPEVFPAVDGSVVPSPEGWQHGGGAWGCLQSHVRVLEWSIQYGVKSLLVLEDDAVLCDNFRVRAEEFVAAVPADWSQLMLGGQHTHAPLAMSDGIVRCQMTHRTHAYAVRGEFMRRLYQHLVNSARYPDHRMGELQPLAKVYAPQQFLIGQDKGHSDTLDGPVAKNFW